MQAPTQVLASLRAKIGRFLKNEDGPTAVEYAVLLALIVTICLGSIDMVGSKSKSTYKRVGKALKGSIK